jgi:hypothetical protein
MINKTDKAAYNTSGKLENQLMDRGQANQLGKT